MLHSSSRVIPLKPSSRAISLESKRGAALSAPKKAAAKKEAAILMPVLPPGWGRGLASLNPSVSKAASSTAVVPTVAAPLPSPTPRFSSGIGLAAVTAADATAAGVGHRRHDVGWVAPQPQTVNTPPPAYTSDDEDLERARKTKVRRLMEVKTPLGLGAGTLCKIAGSAMALSAESKERLPLPPLLQMNQRGHLRRKIIEFHGEVPPSVLAEAETSDKLNIQCPEQRDAVSTAPNVVLRLPPGSSKAKSDAPKKSSTSNSTAIFVKFLSPDSTIEEVGELFIPFAYEDDEVKVVPFREHNHDFTFIDLGSHEAVVRAVHASKRPGGLRVKSSHLRPLRVAPSRSAVRTWGRGGAVTVNKRRPSMSLKQGSAGEQASHMTNCLTSTQIEGILIPSEVGPSHAPLRAPLSQRLGPSSLSKATAEPQLLAEGSLPPIDENFDESCEVYVKNISLDATIEDIEKTFAQFLSTGGRVSVLSRHTNRRQIGYAYVNLGSTDAVQRAVATSKTAAGVAVWNSGLNDGARLKVETVLPTRKGQHALLGWSCLATSKEDESYTPLRESLSQRLGPPAIMMKDPMDAPTYISSRLPLATSSEKETTGLDLLQSEILVILKLVESPFLGIVASKLHRLYRSTFCKDLDLHQYGHFKLKTLIESMPGLVIGFEGSIMYIRTANLPLNELHRRFHSLIESGGEGFLSASLLPKLYRDMFHEDINFEDFGVGKKLKDVVAMMSGLEIVRDKTAMFIRAMVESTDRKIKPAQPICEVEHIRKRPALSDEDGSVSVSEHAHNDDGKHPKRPKLPESSPEEPCCELHTRPEPESSACLAEPSPQSFLVTKEELGKSVEAPELAAVKKERGATPKDLEKAEAKAELLEMMVHPLEAMRHDMKTMMLGAKTALLDAGVPKRKKMDKSVPYWYGEGSATYEEIPWNEEEKRAMVPAEGIAWLGFELQNAKDEAAVNERAFAALEKQRDAATEERDAAAKKMERALSHAAMLDTTEFGKVLQTMKDEAEAKNRTIAALEEQRDAADVERDAAVKERERTLAHAEMLDSMVLPLEKMRHEMKALLLASQSAMLDAGVPSRLKPDKDVPYWYGEHSWTKSDETPWNVEEKRAMTPGEGVAWLSGELDRARAEIKALKQATKGTVQNR